MRISLTSGEDYELPDVCAHCRMNTAGHESGCPLHKDSWKMAEAHERQRRV